MREEMAKKNLSSHMLVQWGGQYIAEFRFANEKFSHVNETCSLPPTASLFKVNVDGYFLLSTDPWCGCRDKG